MFNVGDILIHKTGSCYCYLMKQCKVEHPRINGKYERGFGGVMIDRESGHSTCFSARTTWLEKYCNKMHEEKL